MIKNLKKFNDIDEYPDIHKLSDIHKIFWVLKVSDDKFKSNVLTAEDISVLLWSEFKIDLRPLSIKRILARAKGKVKTFHNDHKRILYSLTNRGEISLMNLHKKKAKQIKKEIFSDSTIKGLNQKFKEDIRELNIVYTSNCGTCTAFMLRKILEKSIYLKFAKNNMLDKLKDKDGKFFGLDNMLKIASTEKVKGLPILTSKTFENLKSSKFLGDTAVHNFMVNISIEMVERELNYIETALREIS